MVAASSWSPVCSPVIVAAPYTAWFAAPCQSPATAESTVPAAISPTPPRTSPAYPGTKPPSAPNIPPTPWPMDGVAAYAGAGVPVVVAGAGLAA